MIYFTKLWIVNLNEKQMEQILSVMTKFRNVCAHGERLFTYKTSDSIGDLSTHQRLNIPMKRGKYLCGKNDLFAIVISLRNVLSNQDFDLLKVSHFIGLYACKFR